MLTATRANVWSFDHNVSHDGRPLCRWAWRGRAGEGAFALDGQPWAVRSNRRRSPFQLVDVRGVVIAIVEETGKRQPDLLHVDGRTHPVQDRSGMFRRECALLDGEQVIGHVTRQVSLTEAHLPTLHLPAQMLLLGVLLARWDAEAQSA